MCANPTRYCNGDARSPHRRPPRWVELVSSLLIGRRNARFFVPGSAPDEIEATVAIRDGRTEVPPGLHGEGDLRVDADALIGIRLLRGDVSIVRTLVTRRIRVRGPLQLLPAVGRFPSMTAEVGVVRASSSAARHRISI